METKREFTESCRALFADVPGNIIDIPGIGVTQMYEEPIAGFTAASDELFERYREEGIIGSMFCGPDEWLKGAKTVVSLFFPFSEAVRSSNRDVKKVPSTEWLYARIEGQAYLNSYMASLKSIAEAAGIRACVPAIDERFGLRMDPETGAGGDDFRANSKWSERHAAYACGLGTFGLSRGLISKKGMAGRYCSIIIDAEFEPDERDYSGVYDYCIRCGACADNCPAKAITLEHGKNNIRCNRYVEAMRRLYDPRYGCGKCQVDVPCECARP